MVILLWLGMSWRRFKYKFPWMDCQLYLFKLEKEAHSWLDGLLLQQEFMYKDRCRVNWLAHWDRNSTYFHNILKARNAQKAIDVHSINGTITSDKATISSHIVHLYSSLFNEAETISNCKLEDVIPYSVTA